MKRSILVGLCFSYLLPVVADAAHDRVEDFATAYRIQVYETFRTDRSEYRRRMEIGKKVEKLARQTNHPQAEERLMEWFSSAMMASRVGSLRPLPPLPDMQPYLAEDLAKQAKQAAKLAAHQADVAKRQAAQQAHTLPAAEVDPGLFGRWGEFVGLGRETASIPPAEEATSQTSPTVATTVATTETTTETTVEPWMRDDFWEEENGIGSRVTVANAKGIQAEVAADDRAEVFGTYSQRDESEPSSETSLQSEQAQASQASPTATTSPTIPGDEELQLLNARIARHNLTLASLRSRFEAAWLGDGSALPKLMPRLERLVTDHCELASLRDDADAVWAQHVIPLDPTGPFLAEVASRLKTFHPPTAQDGGEPTLMDETVRDWREEVETWQAVYF